MANLTIEQAEAIRNAWYDEFYDMNDGVIEIREEYSGRGMYGSTCVAIVCSDPVALGYCMAVAGVSYDHLGGFRTDSMGRYDRVYY